MNFYLDELELEVVSGSLKTLGSGGNKRLLVLKSASLNIELSSLCLSDPRD